MIEDDRQHAITRPGARDHRVRLGGAHRQWLFAEHVLAGLESGQRHVMMEKVGETDRDGLHVVACQEVSIISVAVGNRELVGEDVEAALFCVSGSDEMNARTTQRPRADGMTGRDPAAADDAVSTFLHAVSVPTAVSRAAGLI